MKYKKTIFAVITIMLLLSTVVTPVFAESTGFVTEPMTEEQLNTFYENVSISLLTEEVYIFFVGGKILDFRSSEGHKAW